MPDFSTPAEHAFEQPSHDDSDPSDPTLSSSTSTLSLPDRYSIESTLDHILKNDSYRTIALQFPDELLGDSVLVYRMLMKGIKEHERIFPSSLPGRQCYVLGDSTYGSCCPDVLSSLHLPADLLVHYGHACLTRTESLPVLYVFPKRSLDTSSACNQLYKAFTSEIDEAESTDSTGESKGKNVVVLWDVAYDWLRDDITQAFLNSPDRPSPALMTNIYFNRINSQSSASSSTGNRPKLKVENGSAACCSANTQSSGCCRGPDDTDGKGKSKACDCRQDQPEEAASISGIEQGVQQIGLVNVGGAQEDVSVHAATHSDGAQQTESENHASEGGSTLRSFDFPEGIGFGDCAIFYIGEESRGVVNLMMENSTSKIYQYDPSSDSISALHTRTPRLLQKRLLALHRMYQTTTIGILVHNVGLRSSHAVVKDLRKLIRDKGRKSYTISVGRVRPEKLANFEAIGGWVLVGCKEGGLIDGKEYYRPIVTPHELRLALQGEMESWKPEDWTLDLEAVLRDIKRDREIAKTDDVDGNNDEDDDRPIFSLADGSYHMTRRYGGKEEKDAEQELLVDKTSGALIRRPEGGALVKRNEAGRVAAVHLASRAFKGLDATEGYDAKGNLALSELVDGRVGVARGYRVDTIGKEGQGP